MYKKKTWKYIIFSFFDLTIFFFFCIFLKQLLDNLKYLPFPQITRNLKFYVGPFIP